jgi:membrane protein
MAASADASRSRAPDQPSFTKSLLIIGAAGALNFLIGAPAAPTKEDRPFGETQSGQERIQTQLRRVREPGRGRRATSSIQIPWKGWNDIFWRTVNQASEDRLLAIAAGVVFYGLLALFPAVTALVSCYGLFAKPDSINDHLSFLQGVIPAEAYSVVQDQIVRPG